MAGATLRPLTVQDYRELPEGGPRYQLIDGDLHMTPAPNLFHQRISRNVEGMLITYLEGNPIGEVLDAPVDVFLTETNAYQPDILYVARANAAILKEDGVHGAPDLVIEILSPASEKFDLGSKKRVYARCGVREYWVIDPDGRRVAVYDLAKDPDEPLGTWREGDTFGSALLPGLSIAVSRVFAEGLGMGG